MAKKDKLLGQAHQHLEPGEEILESVEGTYETKILGQDSVRSGVLIATDRRLVFYAKKLGGYDLESFPYSSISSLEQKKAAVMGHSLKFFATGNQVSVKWIQDKKFAEFIEVLRGKMQDGKSATVAAGDPIEQLKKLAELRDAGVVSEDEFEAKKAKLLDEI